MDLQSILSQHAPRPLAARLHARRISAYAALNRPCETCRRLVIAQALPQVVNITKKSGNQPFGARIPLKTVAETKSSFRRNRCAICGLLWWCLEEQALYYATSFDSIASLNPEWVHWCIPWAIMFGSQRLRSL